MNLSATLELLANRKLHYRTKFQGLPISVENRKGSVRKGVDPAWGPWRTKMLVPYGYIRGTEGMDGAEVDVFLGPHPDAKFAYVITTRRPPNFEKEDEQKVALGFASAQEAKQTFLKHFDDPRFFGSMRAIPMVEFKQKVLNGKGKIAAGGVGSGCQGPNCGRPKMGVVDPRQATGRQSLQAIHQEIATAGRAKQTVWLDYQPGEVGETKQFLVAPYSYRGDKLFAYDMNSKGIKAFKLGNIVRVRQTGMGFKPKWPVEFAGEELESDAGEPQLYPYGLSTIEPDARFHPPSLKNPERVPTDDPKETDDRFMDVTKRRDKAVQLFRNQMTRKGKGSDAKYIGVRTTQVGLWPAQFGPGGFGG